MENNVQDREIFNIYTREILPVSPWPRRHFVSRVCEIEAGGREASSRDRHEKGAKAQRKIVATTRVSSLTPRRQPSAESADIFHRRARRATP